MTKFKLSDVLNAVKNYIITILATVVFIFSVCLCVELELLFRCEKRINQEEFQMANLEKFCTIDELEKRLLKEPTNYIINLRLAQVYESLEEYRKAHEFYRSALKLSGRSNLSLYYFAMFCAKHNLNAMSSVLCEDLSGSSKKTIEYKTKIYEAIGDSFMNQKEYPAATKAYQVAYKYAKNIYNRKLYLTVKGKYSDSYIKLADYHIQNANPEHATSALENAIKIQETPYADYRLALIYLDTDKQKAQKYMTKAFEKNPYIVNPFIYNKLLNDLIEETKASRRSGLLNFYSMKQTRFKTTLKNCYVYKNDILIEKTDIHSYKQRFSKNKRYYVSFDIKNNTKHNLNELFIQIELFVNSRRYTVDKKIFTATNPLDAYDMVQYARILLPDDVEFDEKNDVVIKYYVKKKRYAPWTMIKIDSLNF